MRVRQTEIQSPKATLYPAKPRRPLYALKYKQISTIHYTNEQKNMPYHNSFVAPYVCY